MARDKDERIRQGETFARKRGKGHGVAGGPGRAYASIATSQLATQRVSRLSGHAIRILLAGHANWTPRHSAVLPVTETSRLLQIGKSTTVAAIREVTAAELLVPLRAPVRPGRMGSAAPGSAAVFEVAGRRPGTAHRVFEQGDRRFNGSWRIYADDLRRLAASLTSTEARVLVCIVMPCHRDKHGDPQTPHRFSLSGRIVADALPDVAPRTADYAIQGLLSKGLIREIAPAAGRRAAVFEPAGIAASTIRRGRKSRAPEPSACLPDPPGQPDMHGVLQGVPVLRANQSALAKKRRKSVASGAPGQASANVVRRNRTMDPHLRAEIGPGKKPTDAKRAASVAASATSIAPRASKPFEEMTDAELDAAIEQEEAAQNAAVPNAVDSCIDHKGAET